MEEKKGSPIKRVFDKYVDIVSGIFLPAMGAMMGAALCKILPMLFVTLGWLGEESTTYRILYAIGDGFFYFLPILLAYTAAEKFGANKYLSVCIAMALVYPDITAMYSAGAPVTFLGLPVRLISYPSSVLPIIAAVYGQSWLEKGLNKVFPQLIRSILAPVLTLLIMVPATLLVIGPIMDVISSGIGAGISWLLDTSPVLTALILGFFWQIIVLFGFHWGIVPIVITNLAANGGDNLLPLCNGLTFAISGAVLAVLLKTKNAEVRRTAIPAFVSIFVGGISEPAIYGVCLKYKRPFFIVCLCTALAGVPMALGHVVYPGLLATNILTAPALIGFGGMPVVWSIGISFVGAFVLTWLFGFRDSMVSTEPDQEQQTV